MERYNTYVTDLDDLNNKWGIFKLKDIVDDFIVPMRDKPKVFDGNIPWCRIEDIEGKYLNDSLSGQYVSEKVIAEMNLKVHPKGTVICSCSARLGVCAILTKEIVTNQTFIGLVPGKKLNKEFLYYYMTFNEQRLQILSSGTTIAYLSRKEFENFSIKIPTLVEQQKIAKILSTWDFAIENQEQLIEKKKEIKKGLIQRLLTGKVRFKEFNDEWSKKTLDKYITPVIRECDKPSEGYWRLGLRSHGKGTFHQFVEDSSTVAMDKLYEVKSNDLIVNITFAWEHAIAVATSEDEGKLVSHRFPTYEFNKNAHPMYFKYYVLQTKFKNMLVNISPGGAGRNRVMNKKDFLKLEVQGPSYEEQKKIAEVLVAADKEIELLQKELEVLKLQKKGLMQRLLTGEVRVKL